MFAGRGTPGKRAAPRQIALARFSLKVIPLAGSPIRNACSGFTL